MSPQLYEIRVDITAQDESKKEGKWMDCWWADVACRADVVTALRDMADHIASQAYDPWERKETTNND